MTEEYRAEIPRKPKDMSQDEWDVLCESLGPNPECVRLKQGLCKKPCSLRDDGITYPVQWDHVVARSKNGATTAANIQPLCDIVNIQKQAKPDRYWDQGQFFFDIEPDLKNLRNGQIEFAWKPAIKLAEAMLANNSDVYRVYLLLWWIVGGGKTISMPILCSAINHTIKHKGPPGTPRINKLLILAKEAALRDSIAGELKTELTKYGIYNRPPEVRTIDAGDRWNQPGFIDRADIVTACVQQLWEVEREEPRTDEKVSRILSNFSAIAIDESHFGPGQLERLARLAPKSLKFGFSNTPINDLGDILDSFVLLSMLDYSYAKDKDNSLKTLHPFDEGVEQGFYVPVTPEYHRTMVSGIEGDEQDGAHNDSGSIWQWMNVAKEVIKRVKELDRCGRIEAPDDWFSSHGLLRCATVNDAEQLLTQVNRFFENNRDEFPEKDGWRATLIHGNMKGGPPSERRLTHPPQSGLIHPWMRAKNLPNRQCDISCARILIAVDMVREGINNQLCNAIGWTCPSTGLIELIQRIGRAMRAIPKMDRTILQRHQSVHLFWHPSCEENGQAIARAIEWMLDMATSAEGMTTLDDLIEDGTLRNEMDKGSIESVLTSEDKTTLEHMTGQTILCGRDIDATTIDSIIDNPNALHRPVNGERRKSAKEFIQEIISSDDYKEKRVGVRRKTQPIEILCYELPKEHYSDEDLIRHIDSVMVDEVTPETRRDLKKNLTESTAIRELVSNHKRKRDTIFSMAIPQATQRIVGPGGVIPSIAAMYHRRLKGLSVPDGVEDTERGRIGFLISYVTRAAHILLGATSIKNGGLFDRIEYHTALRRPNHDQTMFELVRLQLMIDGHLPTVRAIYEAQINDRLESGLTLSNFEKDLGKEGHSERHEEEKEKA